MGLTSHLRFNVEGFRAKNMQTGGRCQLILRAGPNTKFNLKNRVDWRFCRALFAGDV